MKERAAIECSNSGGTFIISLNGGQRPSNDPKSDGGSTEH
jgi:hypothetical protein